MLEKILLIIAIASITLFFAFFIILIGVLLIKNKIAEKRNRERYKENKRFKEMVTKNKKLSQPPVPLVHEDGWIYCKEHHRYYRYYCMECRKLEKEKKVMER